MKQNHIQLYEYYKSIDLNRRTNITDHTLPRWTRMYPNYVVLTGRAFIPPHPYRLYSFEEFIDKIESDSEFIKVLLNE